LAYCKKRLARQATETEINNLCQLQVELTELESQLANITNYQESDQSNYQSNIQVLNA
jgi:hypothetical protein